MQPADNMIDSPAPDHAVLSQDSIQHLQDLLQAHSSTFDQTDHPADMLDHRPRARGGGIRFGWGHRRFALAVLDGLFDLAGVPTVILDTPPCGLLLAAGLLAAKRTTQVLAPGIAWIGEEKNPAMPAAAQASAQAGLGFQNRSQEQVILQDQSGDLISSIPLRIKLEILRDPNCKKPKFSLTMLRKFDTSSSYPKRHARVEVGRGFLLW